MKDLLKDHPLILQILIAAGNPENFQKKLQLLQDWSTWFSTLNFHLELIICGRSAEASDRALYSWFDCPVSIYFDPDYIIAEQAGLLQSRPVFGREMKSAFCSLSLFDEGELCFESRRINAASLEKLVSRGLNAQNRWLQERIPSFVDSVLSD